MKSYDAVLKSVQSGTRESPNSDKQYYTVKVLIPQNLETIDFPKERSLIHCTLVSGHLSDKMRWHKAIDENPPEGVLCVVYARRRLEFPHFAVFQNGTWHAGCESIKVTPSMMWRLFISGIDAP